MVTKRCAYVLLAIGTGLVAYASETPIPLGDRPLVDVLADYEAAGYSFTYSSELVRRHTRITGEPPTGDAVTRLRRALAAVGLQLRDAPGGRAYRIVAAPIELAADPRDPRRVAGRVTDADTGRPLAGVRVEIDGTVTSTDADGRFALDIRRPAGLSASLQGYAPKTVPVADGGPAPADDIPDLAVALEPAIEEVVVTASRYRIGKRGALSRHVLDDALVVSLPDIGDALRIVNKLPGVRTIGISAIPHVRGGLRDETLVLFNNVELFEPVHLKDFHGLFSGLDPRVIKSIDVYTGGFPARYGNRMSGVLDIEPAVPPPRPAGAVTLSLFNAGAMAYGRAGRGDWALSARRGTLDVVARRLERDVGTPSFHDAYGRFGWEFDPRTYLDTGLILYNDDVEAIDNVGPHREHAFSSYRNTYGWTQLRREWPAGLHTRTLLSYATIRHGRSGAARGSSPDWSSGTVEDRRRFRILDIVQDATFARGVWSAEFGGGARVASGRYDYRASGHRGALAGLLGQTRELHHQVRARPAGWAGHLYGSASVTPWKGVRVEAGGRWDRQRYDDVTADQVSPRVSVRYDIDAATAITVAAGSFSQPQGIHELQVEDGLSRYQQPQTAHHLIAGIDRTFPALGLQVHAEVYVKRFTKLKRRFENPMHPLVLLPELAPDRSSFHPSAARARGAEITVRYRPSRALNAWFSYSRGEAEDWVDRRWRPRRWDQTNSVSSGLVWTTDRWSAAATFLWHDGWRATRLPHFVAEGTMLTPNWNAERLPAFASLDVRISHTWRWSPHGLTAFVECANILDRANVGAIEYELRRDTNAPGFAIVRDPRKLFPIVPSVGFVWEFR